MYLRHEINFQYFMIYVAYCTCVYNNIASYAYPKRLFVYCVTSCGLSTTEIPLPFLRCLLSVMKKTILMNSETDDRQNKKWSEMIRWLKGKA